MSRHFVWMAPLSNLLLFAGIGVVLAMATKLLASMWRVALRDGWSVSWRSCPCSS